MRTNIFRSTLKVVVLTASIFVAGAAVAFGQQQVNLTAGPASITLPDGSTAPMWGYTCGVVVPGSTATCAPLNKAATGWSPVLITVPTGQGLTINLTNSLSFLAGANLVPTSLVIEGQLGAGLGNVAQRTTTPAPDHSLAQANATWPIANTGASATPPAQGPRVQSFSTEVAPTGATLVAGQCASGCALTWTNLRPGTYLLESGTHPSIQVPMGLYGMLVVTAAPAPAVGTAYPGVSYNADVPLLFSEIDPVQNNSVSTAVNTAGFSETRVWSGQPNNCGNPASANYNTCYPPAVNYTPLYYLINGVDFDRTNAPLSNFATSPASGVSGTVLVRLVNAGLRMHVPSIVGSRTGTPAVSGFSLIAEDGNPLPGTPRVQSEVFMAASKTYDVMINAPSSGGPALPVYDRELSLSGNGTKRDAGMTAYISANGNVAGNTNAGASGPSGASLPSSLTASAAANPDTYNSLVAGRPFTVSDPAKGVIANDVNVYGVKISIAPTNGTVTLNTNGTFTYVPTATATSDSFGYCANGTTTVCTTVTLGAAPIESASGIIVNNVLYVSKVATYINIPPPGPLSVDKDTAGYPLQVAVSSVAASAGLTVTIEPNGGFIATAPGAGIYTFTYQAQNSQGTLSVPAMVTLNFPAPSNLAVSVLDGKDKRSGITTPITDYRWIIEEDKTFYINPNCGTNSATQPLGCPPVSPGGTVPTFGVNFHTSHMEFVAQGCTGPLSCESGQTLLGVPAACDVGNGICRTTASQETAVLPGQVQLDPTKHYYISVLPGDAANPFNTGNASSTCTVTNGVSNCGHTMGGAPIPFPATVNSAWAPVTILVEPTPLPTGKLSVMVFEDDFPLNGEQDAGGGIDVIATNEPGLGGFNIIMWDDMGGSGDVTGQMTYDMFNMPLSNSLAGTIDPTTGLDACPISPEITSNTTSGDGTQKGITGMIVTCPKFESDGMTLSPLTGQAVVANLMPGRFSVQAIPGADRIARGEEWLQTNTLDGQHPHDSFIRIGEPSYFQEFGPAGYHVAIGFANPAIINARKAGVCSGLDLNLTGTNCTNTVTGRVTGERMSRTPDERLYSSGSRDTFYWTQCYVSLGDPDGEDFMFTKCDAGGNFTLTGVPYGNWRLSIFDQWNDQLMDGLSTPVAVGTAATPGGNTVTMGDIPVQQWQSNVYTRTFVDDNKDGVSQSTEAGIPLINTTVRYRDGSLANNLGTDFNGIANFNETFPLFSWYVVETDTTRYKTTGIHTVYDAGGPADGSTFCGTATNGNAPCGTSTIGRFLANTYERTPLPSDLSVPGAVYCADADCTGLSIANGPTPSSTTNHSTGRIDPPWVPAEGWQGFSGQNNFIEFGKTPYVPNENGGISGHVVYASTRPFDDPQMLVQTQWTPLVPHVTINLYQEGFAVDGVTPTLTLIDHTQTSSWDDWAQGFRSDGKPNMNCPGQLPAPTATAAGDLFFFSLYNQPNYLNPSTPLPYNSQYKCYDGMHNWNQLQPAPYDGMYAFPSVTGMNPTTGKPTGTNCTICTTNPDTTDPFRYGTPMLPPGKYVVEVVPPPGYEIVKEEDKNILIGDNFIAPVAQEFGGLVNIFIMPDQAQVGSAYNANNAQNPTQSLGTKPNNQIVPGFVPEPVWPCVGQSRIVPDYISLFPQSKEVSPFAGATRNLCDRKEVTLENQMGARAKFFIFTSTHIASKYTGVITDDFTSEFDPFAPTFGEKFSPASLPVSIRDWAGSEISRVYSDQWGLFDGLTYSTWEVNPPNPTGYSPTMMVTCMNDAGPILDTNPNSPTYNQMITDPLFNPLYSQFCYELPFMPGTTDYMDTPVVPTAGLVGSGYNNPDCSYPDATPAISEVDGDGIGPWVSAAGHQLTITALGNQAVSNSAYSGPSASAVPFNQKTVTRHFGFGVSKGSVTIGGVAATVTAWSDTQIIVTVPGGVPACALQQQAQYGGSAAQCGELVITEANGKQSVDSVTVTIGGKAPTHVIPPATIQSAIDAAAPGDLIIVNPGAYYEMVLMWKPVRLQGVGAASSVINASTHPAGKLDPWRRQVNCLFGLALNGQPLLSVNNVPNPYDPTGTYTCPGTGWNYFNGGANNPQVDRIPLEGIVGWDTSVNGNLAEMLQEPSLMGAYEGAGITVLGRGVRYATTGVGGEPVYIFGNGNIGNNNQAHEGQFPQGSTLLTNSDADCITTGNGATGFSSNFLCNPSGIDGLGVTNSSQGGGGIFVHGWGHNIQIANNRVYNNTGTLSGGISIGQGETPDALLVGNGGDPLGFDQAPWTCLPVAQQNALPLNTQLPYCYNTNVNMHHNSISQNSSIGDELFSSTPTGSGGVTITSGSDYYTFTNNWVCGNLSTGDGGGLGHVGFIYNGDIEHNTFIFNQSTNPSIQTNGGGLLVMGAPPDGQVTQNGVVFECGSITDTDCAPGLGDGSGPGLIINANLFRGNAADSGSGGGIRLQAVNGTDVPRSPNPGTCVDQAHCLWYMVSVTNNIIDNNVAGWDGGGISLEDSLAVNIVNNTISSNDTTASSGVLFNTIGAPLASTQSPQPTCTIPPPNGTLSATASCPQPAGLVTLQNSPQLISSFTTGSITCPPGHFASGGGASNGACTKISYPLLYNNIFWQNRSFHVGVGALGSGALNQQNVVSLYNAFTNTPAASQASTGACPAGASYWDIGVRNDTGPADHSSGFTLNPVLGVLTSAAGYSGTNLSGNPLFLSQYCNGSRVPPENGGLGYNVPPGISDAVVPNPIFSLTPTATVDEGNNWINMSWGPLSVTNPVVTGGLYGNYGGGAPLGDYTLTITSPAVNHISCTNANAVNQGCQVSPGGGLPQILAPTTDFFGKPRPDTGTSGPPRIDVGAAEIQFNASPLSVSLTANVTFPAPSGTSIMWTATTAGGIAPLTYQFWLCNGNVAACSSATAVWTIVQAYGASNTYLSTPAAGTYSLQVWVRNAGSTANYNAWTSATFTVTAPGALKVTSLTANVTFPVAAGTPVTWTAAVSGGIQPYTYQFWLCDGSVANCSSATAVWSIAQAYSAINTFTLTPASGTYSLQVWVRNAASTANYDAWSSATFTVNSPQPTSIAVGLVSSVVFPVTAGTPVTWTATVSGGVQPYTYQFWLCNGNVAACSSATAVWTIAQAWGASSTYLSTPAAGTYSLQVWVRNSGSVANYDAYSSATFTVNPAQPLTVTGLTSNVPSPMALGTPITWTATASGGVQPYTYQFWLCNGNVAACSSATAVWTIAQAYSAGNSFTLTPAAGTYSLQVWVRNSGSVANYNAWSSATFTVNPAQPLTVTSLISNVALPVAAGTPVTWTATASGGTQPYTYQFWICNGNVAACSSATAVWTIAQAYSAVNTFTLTPAAGTYCLQVWVRNSGSAANYDAWSSATFTAQ